VQHSADGRAHGIDSGLRRTAAAAGHARPAPDRATRERAAVHHRHDRHDNGRRDDGDPDGGHHDSDHDCRGLGTTRARLDHADHPAAIDRGSGDRRTRRDHGAARIDRSPDNGAPDDRAPDNGDHGRAGHHDHVAGTTDDDHDGRERMIGVLEQRRRAMGPAAHFAIVDDFDHFRVPARLELAA
jgi:hypothetical protein